MLGCVFGATCPVFKCDSNKAGSGETCSVLADSFSGITIKKCENEEDWCYSTLFNATFDSQANVFLSLFGTC